MSEVLPWDLHANDERTSDGLTTFIVFCEDGVCEPLYLNSLAVGAAEVNFIDNARFEVNYKWKNNAWVTDDSVRLAKYF
ncbi:hypothetical protein [Chitinophaga sp. LS1]|uniref:hypothetical protein n=1 Tax=Chitinophaga sp. LS1 TaxID=3051176 RepID=UPI002AAB2203|nr:hypothetical protein [Chitinophaga sp. LS1]WPV63772.1 hypothetical protein QQL36_18400 [Chitinophaga sp. LS1]